jgi:diguanylate cyclase (GGDEF)-like protein
MSQSFSDKLPVVVLYTQSGSHRVFFSEIFRDQYYLLEVDSEKALIDKLYSMHVLFCILEEKCFKDIGSILRKIKAEPSCKEMPVLIITSNLKRSHMQDLLTAGATDFLRTPFDQEIIMQTLASAAKYKKIEKKIGPIAKSLSENILLSGSTTLQKGKVFVHDKALKYILKSLETKNEIALLMIELAQMDAVTKRWGESGAVELMSAIQKTLESLTRPQDIIEEISKKRLVIILPSTSKTAATIFAENIQESLKDHKFTTSKGSVKLNLTIGVVSLNQDQLASQGAYENLENMLKTGESYLEKAKELGSKIVSS